MRGARPARPGGGLERGRELRRLERRGRELERPELRRPEWRRLECRPERAVSSAEPGGPRVQQQRAPPAARRLDTAPLFRRHCHVNYIKKCNRIVLSDFWYIFQSDSELHSGLLRLSGFAFHLRASHFVLPLFAFRTRISDFVDAKHADEM